MRERARFLNLLKRNQSAAHLVGMPWEHAEVFMRVARSENCVISSRQLGRVCTGLMREGYDTKGFRIKSKSCDFGPMAGFICADPRFHKKGAAYDKQQMKDIKHALDGDSWDKTNRWRATLEQICITDERIKELLAWDDIGSRDARINAVEVVPNIRIGSVVSPIRINYVLRKELRFKEPVWAIYYTDKEIPKTPVLWRQAAFEVLAGDLGLKPMLALTNPYPTYPKGHFKNCCTGDYDLFGVWAHSRIYQPFGEDRRIAGMNPLNTNQQIIEWEDKRLGNVSNRIHTVAQLLNSLAHADGGGGGSCRNIVNHSDEAGRPFISGIDDHVIAFIPGPENYIVGIESPQGVPNVTQWQAFFLLVASLGFKITINAHWRQQIRLWGLEKVTTMGDARGWQPSQSYPGRSS